MAVNKELVGLYWDLGKMITQKQKEQGWGKSVVETLASDLQKEFSVKRGYSATNFWHLVQLYTEYQDDTILQSLIGEIGRAYNILIFSKCNTTNDPQYIYSLQKSTDGPPGCWNNRSIIKPSKNIS